MENKFKEDIFIKNYPSLDLHGETSDFVPALVKDFININVAMGKEKLVIIHGRSGGVLKQTLHSYLKSDARVNKYYIYNMNDGLTIVELKPQVKFL